MKVLRSAEMQEVDRRSIAAGIPGLVLMENAARGVVDFLARRYAPLERQRVLILCGKGNNGGDGFAIARQLRMRFPLEALWVVAAAPVEELRGDARDNARMLEPWGIPISRSITAPMRRATLVVDALLGTGLRGAATGPMAQWIEEINSGFPDARVVAVDLPSGMVADEANSTGPLARADATVTFTAPKPCLVLPPNCDRIGELHVAPVGSPPSLHQDNPALYLSLIEKSWFSPLFRPRERGAHKGGFGHVLVVGGSVGKTGAAAMAGVAALRSGAGLVTVASAQSALPQIAAYQPELMTEPLPETAAGSIGVAALSRMDLLSARKSVMGLGPGLGTDPETERFAQAVWERSALPVIVDADAINALAGTYLHAGGPRILTPHPGEMARLAQSSVEQVQSDRVGTARAMALDRDVTVILKGQRTVIAFPDGRVWINPTGTPALATGGSGDILTGLLCGLLAQFPAEADYALGAAVWLHGRAAELGAAELGEKCLLATDVLRYLPPAMRELEPDAR